MYMHLCTYLPYCPPLPPCEGSPLLSTIVPIAVRLHIPHIHLNIPYSAVGESTTCMTPQNVFGYCGRRAGRTIL